MMILTLVVPCFNEEQVLPLTSSSLCSLLMKLVGKGKVSKESRIYFVDDGSKDKTWQLIKSLSSQNMWIRGIKLSRNYGHQNALLAGLFSVDGDVVITIDADLQDDLDAIEDMVDEYLQGSEIVYGVRSNRESDSFLKRYTAENFYKILRLLGVDVVYNHADYRLLSRRAIEALKEYREIGLYIRGIIPLIGFRSSSVYYKRSSRAAGESKYPLLKALSLAWEGMTSMSIMPLRFVTLIGIIVFATSIIFAAIVLYLRFFSNKAIPGWTSIILPIFIIGGIQILCIGIIGEYLGKIFQEVKARPRYLIEEQTLSMN